MSSNIRKDLEKAFIKELGPRFCVSWKGTANFFKFVVCNPCYYMASSVSGRDESNPALWLATRAGKMELSCPLRTTHRVPQEKFPQKPYNKSFIDQACSDKMPAYWPHSFFASLWTSTPSWVYKHAKKELGQHPAILTEQAWSISHTYPICVCLVYTLA